MIKQAISALALITFLCAIPVGAHATLTEYSQDFENLVQVDPFALADDGWLVYGNVWDKNDVYLYGYGPFPAPNDGFGFCQIDAGQGGVDQGAQQLSIFSDYNNVAHADTSVVESNTFQELTITSDDVGKTFVFSFQAKIGNLEGVSTAEAFIKTLDPGAGYALTNYISENMTSIPDTWGGWSLELEIDAGLDGQIFQFGFSNKATLYQGAGVFYDNLVFKEKEPIAAPVARMAGAILEQNYPNPFNPTTRINFSLENAGHVDIRIFDLAGRQVTTLHQGELGIGDHHVVWSGMNDAGHPVASGQYLYMLKTASGEITRSMVLLK